MLKQYIKDTTCTQKLNIFCVKNLIFTKTTKKSVNNDVRTKIFVVIQKFEVETTSVQNFSFVTHSNKKLG